ncbi:hypothetical protein [Rhodococcus jostii]|uniref:hypothetical protein n=1 Tax=Rhodococcus jostii TaxID=132919 RepID=UPI0036438203
MMIEAELHKAIVVDRSIEIGQVAELTGRTVRQVERLILGGRVVTAAEVVVVAGILRVDWRLLLSDSRDCAA